MARDSGRGEVVVPVERITGMDDLLPQQARQVRSLESALCGVFDSFGYEPVATPVVERAELFRRKSGSDILAKLYAFEDQGGHAVTLRPEITASLIRLFVERGQATALPVRWYYSGPVFRYERPQRGRRRQFTQVGLELIGATGPAADAEAIAVAVAGLRAVGIDGFRVVLGHVGVILQLLENLQLPDRLRGLLMANLEDLARGRRGPHQIEEELRGLGLVAVAGDVLT
ncbi:MAG: ATP phosphoribosyltransferase regulatory subunit, partial [Chloroflexi bacterium]|nr:ATP phosphoribosyltransferase regulatory subunit [Chloroflexota bacterium]